MGISTNATIDAIYYEQNSCFAVLCCFCKQLYCSMHIFGFLESLKLVVLAARTRFLIQAQGASEQLERSMTRL